MVGGTRGIRDIYIIALLDRKGLKLEFGTESGP